MRRPTGPQILLIGGLGPPTEVVLARLIVLARVQPNNLCLQDKKTGEACQKYAPPPPQRAHFEKCWTQKECGVNGAYAVFTK